MEQNRNQSFSPDTNKVPGQTTDAEPKKKVQLIPNPLPGPKPHMKRNLNYDYDVPADKMHYDIENPQDMYYDYE